MQCQCIKLIKKTIKIQKCSFSSFNFFKCSYFHTTSRKFNNEPHVIIDKFPNVCFIFCNRYYCASLNFTNRSERCLFSKWNRSILCWNRIRFFCECLLNPLNVKNHDLNILHWQILRRQFRFLWSLM